MVQTWEVTCVWCKELRWPYQAEKPDNYTCVRCRSVPEEKRMARQEQAQRSAASKKARQASP